MDVDGDGVQEIAVANRYGQAFVLSADEGKRVGWQISEPGDVQMAIVDLHGDGTVEMANGSATGAFKVGQVGSRRR